MNRSLCVDYVGKEDFLVEEINVKRRGGLYEKAWWMRGRISRGEMKAR